MQPDSEDVVQSTLTELMMLLIFFFVLFFAAIGDEVTVSELEDVGISDELYNAPQVPEPDYGFDTSSTSERYETQEPDTIVGINDLMQRSSPNNDTDGVAPSPSTGGSIGAAEPAYPLVVWRPQEEGDHSWRIVIPLEDTDGYSFESGQSLPNEEFVKKFNGKAVVDILSHLDQHGKNIDLIEVVGHTDEVPVKEDDRDTEIDYYIKDFVNDYIVNAGRIPPVSRIQALAHADNAGLGLVRATVVAAMIAHAIRDRHPDVEVHPLSAAFLINTDGTLAAGKLNRNGQKSRRRIEVFFRKKFRHDADYVD